MWLSKLNIAAVFASLLVISACGFAPAFGPAGNAGNLHGKVQMEDPANRNDFDLTGQLEQRLGHATEPAYRLTYDARTTEDGTGLTPAQERIRFNVVGSVQFSLIDISSGAVLTRGSVSNFTGYSVDSVDATATPPGTSATISTLSAKRDAERRLMVILADQIVTQLVASAAGWNQ